MSKEKLPKYVRHTTKKNRSGRTPQHPYQGNFTHQGTTYYCGSFDTIKETQIAVDIKRLDMGLKPNILKKC